MLEQFVISIQIIIIDIVMAADNAIIIGLIASGFAKQNRKRIIAWGVAAAFVFRVVFAFGATYILEFAWLKILGGLLLNIVPESSILTTSLSKEHIEALPAIFLVWLGSLLLA